MPESADTDLLLKKRARRRLLGAVAFAGLAAVVLPMVMDDEPKQQVQDVQIRIPGQDQTPFTPKLNRPAKPEAVEEVAKTADKGGDKASEKPVEKSVPKVADKPLEKTPAVALPAEKVPEKTVEKKTDKAAEKTADKVQEKPQAT